MWAMQYMNGNATLHSVGDTIQCTDQAATQSHAMWARGVGLGLNPPAGLRGKAGGVAHRSLGPWLLGATDASIRLIVCV